MAENVRDYLGPEGSIARRLEGYEERPEQLELAAAVEFAVGKGHHLLAEAGTGTGKSFAYLLPAVLHAIENIGKGPVIISTRTIALQEQLIHKDLPFLQSVLPHEWSAVQAVGRNNYVCLRRMNLAQRERGVLFPDVQREAELTQIVDWSMTTLEGTRQDLPHPVDNSVWEEVRAEHNNCLNKACKHYSECFYQGSRRRMASAQILVVNHALYMSDVALRMAGTHFLPQHKVAILDEAHHLERTATESLGLRLALGTFEWHFRRLHARRSKKSLLAKHCSPRAMHLLEELRYATQEFFAMLDAQLGNAYTRAVGKQAIPDPLSEPLAELGEEILRNSTEIKEVNLRMELQARARALSGLQKGTAALCQAPDQNTVRWLEKGRRSAELRSAPLEVKEALGQWVFDDDRTCILTSATLGPGSDPEYQFLRDQLGIRDAETLRLGSPFDYSNNVRLLLPEALPDPTRDSQAYLRACTHHVIDQVIENGGRALILCTSWAFVRSISDALRPALTDASIKLLVQGEAPIRQLLDGKKADPTSVLVGTESLWEGIDVPGEALTLLVLTRLPFAQPDHPLTRARLDRISERGGNPFYDHTLPEAVLRFRQGFGRLVRTTHDRGTVMLLDPRARTKSYGRRFLDALPEGTLDDPFGI